MTDETRTQVAPSTPTSNTTDGSGASAGDSAGTSVGSGSGADPEVAARTKTGAAAGTQRPTSEVGTVAQSPAGVERAAAESRNVTPGVAAVPGYQILGELGRGAMGVVYKARHVKLNRIDALKMTLGGRADEKNLIRFLAEAEAVASVKHENVVQVYDYGEVEGHPYMALEFCPGGSLAQRLTHESRLRPREAAATVARVAAGVAAAHEQGIVHRDLKPQNVLLSAGGEPKVADFGLAKRAASDLTATQAVMGTPSYMSPEQAGGKTKFVGPQADVWALGVILYECLSGELPFPGSTTHEVLAKVLSSEPAAVRTTNSDIPRDLELICRKCLEKNPADRYPSARELADDLDRFARGEPISVRPLTTVARTARWTKRNPVVAGLLTVVILVTLGLIGSLYAQYQNALTRANTEREAKESAEREKQQSDLARQNAERAANEARLREEAEKLKIKAEQDAKLSAAQAAQADDLIALLDDMFKTSDPLAGFFGDSLPGLAATTSNEGQAATLAPFLRNAATRFRASLTDPAVALVKAKLLASIGNGMKNLGLFKEAKGVLEEALALRKSHLKETDPDLWKSELDLGRLEAEGGDFLAAIDRFRRVHAMQTRAGAPANEVLYTRLYEGITLSTAGLAEADAVLREVVRERDRVNGKSHKDTLLAKLALITWLLERNQYAEVVTLFGQFREGVQAIPEKRIRDIFGPVLDCQAKLALAHAAMAPGSIFRGGLRGYVSGVKDDIARLEKLLPEDHILVIVFRFELAKLLLEVNEGKEADEIFVRIVEDARRTVGLAHPKALNLLDIYAKRLVATNRVKEARALFEQIEKANRDRFGPENPWLTLLLLERAMFEQKQGAPAVALTRAKEAAALIKGGKFLPSIAGLHQLFEAAKLLSTSASNPLQATGRELYAALYPVVEKAHGPKSEEMVIVLSAEGQMLYDARERSAALAALRKAESLLPEVPKLKPIERTAIFFTHGRLELDRGRFAEAESLFRATRDAGKQVSGYSASAREDDALFLGYALSAQGKFKEAVPLFEEAKKLAVELRRDERGLAWADHLIAAAQLAAGDRDAHAKTVERMFRQYGKSTSLDTLSRLAWSGGLGGKSPGGDPTAFAERYAAAFKPTTTFPWGYRGLALVRLRAGDATGAEAALAKVGTRVRPADHLLRGLVAVARNDTPTARLQLTKAEQLIDAEKPIEKNPYAYANRLWHEVAETAVLLAELRAAVAPAPAPAPREK